MFIDVSEVLTAFINRPTIALMLKATSTTETSINFYQTTGAASQKTAIFFALALIYKRREIKVSF
jgi:hypothetical protein